MILYHSGMQAWARINEIVKILECEQISYIFHTRYLEVEEEVYKKALSCTDITGYKYQGLERAK